LFWIYLSRILMTLDPSNAIPDHMQRMIDTLVEGMVVIDEQDRIVMANEAFANSAFSPVERLIGRELSSLPWLSHDSDAVPDPLPWKAAAQSNLPQRDIALRLQIGARRARCVNINASPILDPGGINRGVLITFADQTVVDADNAQLAEFVGRFNNE